MFLYVTNNLFSLCLFNKLFQYKSVVMLASLIEAIRPDLAFNYCATGYLPRTLSNLLEFVRKTKCDQRH